ncbi:MAG: hypothetical protein WDA71_11285 [Actinomycetota bacterium]
MKIIKAACPLCGGVDLEASAISLRISPVPGASAYSFVCPECASLVEKPADGRVIQLLLSGGVRAQALDVPAEVLERHAGPPISYDDVLDFALAVSSPERFERGISELSAYA